MARSVPARTMTLATCLALTAVPVTAEVFRYKDSNGHWVYADRPDAARAVEPVHIDAGAAAPRIAVEPRSTPDGISIVAVNECRCSVEFGLRVGKLGDGETGRETVGPRSELPLL